VCTALVQPAAILALAVLDAIVLAQVRHLLKTLRSSSSGALLRRLRSRRLHAGGF